MATNMTRADIIKNAALQMAIDHHRTEVSRVGDNMQPTSPGTIIGTAKAFLLFLSGK